MLDRQLMSEALPKLIESLWQTEAVHACWSQVTGKKTIMTQTAVTKVRIANDAQQSGEIRLANVGKHYGLFRCSMMLILMCDPVNSSSSAARQARSSQR